MSEHTVIAWQELTIRDHDYEQRPRYVITALTERGISYFSLFKDEVPMLAKSLALAPRGKTISLEQCVATREGDDVYLARSFGKPLTVIVPYVEVLNWLEAWNNRW